MFLSSMVNVYVAASLVFTYVHVFIGAEISTDHHKSYESYTRTRIKGYVNKVI